MITLNNDENHEFIEDDDLINRKNYLYYLIEANNIGLLNTLQFECSLEKLKDYINMYKKGNEYSKYYLKCLLAHTYNIDIKIPYMKLPSNYVTLYKNKYRYHNEKTIIYIGNSNFNIGLSENSISIPELQRELTKYNINYNINEYKSVLYDRLIKYIINKNLLFTV